MNDQFYWYDDNVYYSRERELASNHKIGHDFEFTIHQKLNLSDIIANEVKVNQGDDGIDIIATYKNNFVLIQCKSIEKPIAVQTLRNFESSIEDTKYLTIKASSWVKSSKFNLSVCDETSIISTIKNHHFEQKNKENDKELVIQDFQSDVFYFSNFKGENVRIGRITVSKFKPY
ncbi:hypothetical protein C2G38_2208845 [Gigaspora rosea]|uniref:Restriction endonuclease type IV Mrr domain-containing protein n=1 Tax=Gigaspora rosea TaxID=44941 RepID=A0A397UH04_9GLOM|nr:hypothetical protein C2G38_2208845 [Gigaspora rosea]